MNKTDLAKADVASNIRAWLLYGLLLVGLLPLPLTLGMVNAQSRQKPNAANSVFNEVAETVGLQFVHYNGWTGQYHLPEITGAGAAFFDFDNDGDLDVYLPQGAQLSADSTPWRGTGALRGRLYRNELPRGQRTGKLRFTDVTEQSGIQATGYGMGVTVGDFDNDGWDDLYLCMLGKNQLWRNRGDGTFTEVGRVSGTAVQGWSSSAAFFDYDRDGWLDLFVVKYVVFNIANSPACYANSTNRDYCTPHAYRPAGNHLFHNRGDGTFAEVTSAAGIQREFGNGLGVVTADFNGDGWQDVYVANDGDPNQLWLNQHDGTFKNDAWLAGAAVNANGQAEAGMGVDAGDFDGNGTEDIFITHLMEETNTLYLNLGKGLFEDRTREAGLAMQSQRYTGFGTLFFDYDNDGWLDLLVTNGAVRSLPELALKHDSFPFGQPNQLFHNNGKGAFTDVSAVAGAGFQSIIVGRGAAFGDVDNDGDTDVLIANNHGPVRLFLNQIGQRNNWLGLRIVGTKEKRAMLGTRVEVKLASGRTLWRRVRTDGGYLSAQDARVLIGLGQAKRVEQLRIYWPDGTTKEWKNPPILRYLVIER